MGNHPQLPCIRIGVMFSTSGPYATVGRELRDGALLGLELANARHEKILALKPEIINPEGSLERYREATEKLLSEGVRHIIGCYTSSSRKEIIPIVEKYGALLWYPSHYEGFESCPSVIYTGASPNQHVVPLAHWVLPRFGRTAYCIGSNYIWPWENTRIMRGLVREAGGTVLRERYLPLGSADIEPIIAEIGETRPDFIFNTLIGESAYHFYRAYHRLGLRDDYFLTKRCPSLSCTLSEPELHAAGTEAAAGHIASSVYFQSVARPENASFTEAFRARFGTKRVTSADAEAAFITAQLLATSLAQAATDEVDPVRSALYACHMRAPQGEVWIDADNNHAWLTPRIGCANDRGDFDIVWEAERPWQPDPYLTMPLPISAQENVKPVAPKLHLVRN